MNLIAEFYTLRSYQSGQHMAVGGGYTQNIDDMVSFTTFDASKSIHDSLVDNQKKEHYICRWTMIEM